MDALVDKFSSDICHKNIVSTRKPLLAFDENADYDEWKNKVKEKLTELLGDMPERVPLNVQIEWEEEHENFIEKRFTFDTEVDASVPCHLLIPKGAKTPVPVIICLQGHSTGMHISLNRAKYLRDEAQINNGDRDFAIQAVNEGYAALVIEQRGFGERLSMRSIIGDAETKKKIREKVTTGCEHPAMAALLLGRTFIGERVWDVSRAIDALYEFSEIDTDKIACMGNSGGGTATYYAACMEERIKIAMPSCSVCTFDRSIGIMRHCICDNLIVAPVTCRSDERKVYLPSGNWRDYWTKEPVSSGWFIVCTDNIPVYEKCW